MIFSKPGCRHPDCLVVSKEGLMRFYPGGDTLDPEIGKIDILPQLKFVFLLGFLESNKFPHFCVLFEVKKEDF